VGKVYEQEKNRGSDGFCRSPQHCFASMLLNGREREYYSAYAVEIKDFLADL
jgi:hypothetical protein